MQIFILPCSVLPVRDKTTAFIIPGYTGYNVETPNLGVSVGCRDPHVGTETPRLL